MDAVRVLLLVAALICAVCATEETEVYSFEKPFALKRRSLRFWHATEGVTAGAQTGVALTYRPTSPFDDTPAVPSGAIWCNRVCDMITLLLLSKCFYA